MYERILLRGVTGGGYDTLFGLLMADLLHLARLPTEALAVRTATQADAHAAPLPDTAGEMGPMASVPPHPTRANLKGFARTLLPRRKMKNPDDVPASSTPALSQALCITVDSTQLQV